MNRFPRSVSPVILLALTVASSSQHIFAQDAASVSKATEPLQASSPAAARTNRVETSIAVGAAGQLTTPRISDTTNALITQSLSPSAGLSASFRQSFKPWLGYSVNLGYTRVTYRYTSAASAPNTGTSIQTFIPNNLYETSVSYIAQKHLPGGLSLFGELGAGALAFAAISPGTSSSPNFFLTYRNNSFRPEGIAGFGVDYRLSHGFGIRGEYRSLFAKFPDYASGSIRPTTVISEPTLSLTYTFGARSKR